MNEETIKARIAQLEKDIADLDIRANQAARFVAQANQDLSFLNGQLVALKGLLQPQDKPNEQTEPAAPQT